MNKSNLIEILNLLAPKELKDFGEYVRSPYVNKNETLIKLYDHIKDHIDDKDSPELKKENVYKKLTGKKTYNDGFMRTVIFNLSKLAEDYLSNIVTPDYEKEILLLDTYFKRGSNKLYEKKLKQLNDMMAKDTKLDQYHYYCLYRIQALKVAYNSKNRAFLNVKDFHEDDEMKVLDSLFKFYLLASLPEFSFFYNQKNVVNLELEFGFLDDIISYLHKSSFHKSVPLLDLYFHELMLAKYDDEKNYFSLKEIVNENLINYSFGVKYNAIGLLTNKALIEYYKGNDKFLEERFEIHNIIIKEGLYKKFEDSFFDDMLFKNIVIVGLQLNKIEWTENFIKENIDKLTPDDKENAYNLNMARLQFYKKNYEGALEHLNKIKNVKHVHYKTEIKIISLMIYYEQDKNHEAVAVVDNYRHFLFNDALLPQNRKLRNSNFVKFTNELIKIKENMSAKAIYDLQYDIKNTPNTYEKEWLLAKTELLLKSI